MLPILVFALGGLGTCRASPDDLADKQEREGEGEGESESRGESRLASLTSPLSCYSYLPGSCRRTQTRRRTPLLVPRPSPSSSSSLPYQIYSLYIFLCDAQRFRIKWLSGRKFGSERRGQPGRSTIVQTQQNSNA